MPAPALSLAHYNVKGNGVSNWTTNSAQVRAIGRQVAYLQPDVITLNEIPFDFSYEMTNFVKAYLPGYALAMNSGTDGFIRSVIASRHPIVRSTKWLDGVSLAAFGYNGNFTRDLFEAEIAAPNFKQHLHVFTTHLKAGSPPTGTTNDVLRRAAEASAISNFFVTAFLTTNASRPYVLTGDFNEDVNTNRAPAGSGHPVDRLISGPTGLRLTTPRNPVTNDERTWSIQAASLSIRFDYILPGGLLFSNIASSQVFRTDVLNPTPLGLLSLDDKTASDHLPVLMVFHNPYALPYRLTSITASNAFVRLDWQTTPGERYQVESTTNFLSWSALATNLTATGTNISFSTGATGDGRCFRIYRAP